MIQVRNLTKIYQIPKQNYQKNLKNWIWTPTEDKIGVQDIDFQVNEGEIVGFIGPNGAGKTTTIKMLTGILTPTSGNVLVNGYVPYKERAKFTKEIGVLMGQKSILFYDIPVIESFKFFKDVYALSTQVFEDRLYLLSESLNLQPILKIPVRKLSLGQRMRCEFVASLLHNPKVLFLDEPTLGLDIIAKQKILEFLSFLNDEFKTTIFLTTHDLNDIDRLCQRVIILNESKVCYDGDLERIESRDKYKIIQIKHSENFDLKNVLQNCDTIISSNEFESYVKVPINSLTNIMGKLIFHKQVLDININYVSLEEIIRDIYENPIKEGEVS